MPTWPNSKLRSRCFSPTPHYPYPQPTSVSLSLSLSKTKSKHLKLLAPNLNSTMATSITTSQIQSSILTFSSSLNPNGNHVFLLRRTNPSSLSLRSSKIHQSNQLLGFRNPIEYLRFERELCSISCNSSKEDGIQPKGNGPDWPILKRWVVLWKWQTVILTMIACGLSFVLTGLVETASLPYLGVQIGELTLNEKAEILFVDQAIASAATLGVLYSLTNSFQPLPDDAFHFELREPFNLQNGWLLWAGIGLIAALSAIALLGVSMSLLGGENPQRETDALVRLLPLIGYSGASTFYLVGITGVLAPVLEETVFRGFLMMSLTKWFSTPVSVLVSAVAFSLAHFTPGEFPQLFVLGTALGFSYAQTRNLLTPITIHALWNSGVILLLTFLQLQGYDIKELLQQ